MLPVKRQKLEEDVSETSDHNSVESDDIDEQSVVDCSSDDDDNSDDLIKNRFLKVLKKIENGGATDFAVSGILPNAPIHLITIKVRKQFKIIPIVFKTIFPSSEKSETNALPIVRR